MRRLIIIGTLAAASQLAMAEVTNNPSGVLVQGDETTNVFVASSKEITSDNYRKTLREPGTYITGDGIYLMPDGTCVHRVSTLVELKTNPVTQVQQPELKITATASNCPTGAEVSP